MGRRKPGSVVRAAGGVVWRRGAKGDTEILVVHRPRHDDWSLPKGKADGDESDLDCARREVQEETGFRCVAGPELQEVTYPDRHRRPKRVRYWAMQAVGGGFVPNDEVDQIRWVRLDEADTVLTYDHDHQVVQSLLTALPELEGIR